MTAKIQLVAKKPEAVQADVLVALVDSATDKNPLVVKLDKLLGGGLKAHLAAVDFQWEKGGVVQIPTLGRIKARQVVLVGLRTVDGGDGAQFGDSARVTSAIATGVRGALQLLPGSIGVLPGAQTDMRAVGQGAGLGAYKFDKYLTKPKKRAVLKLVTVARASASAAEKKEFSVGLRLAEGVCMARDLVNEPPNVLTPAEFAARARQVAKKNKLTAKILDHKGIQKAGMNLHYAVGKGSENLPYFIHLTYKPARPRGRVAFVGKGITFDSGGLCIKPGPSMLDMKTDMSGAGAVLGLMEAISALKPDVEVHGIIGAAENMPDANAYRPSDVLQSLSGKGVEVINTDAEGRMVLADALTYASRLSPDFIVDAATLTGATLVSLGAPYSAFYTGSEGIASAMKEAAAEAGESFWHMPLIEELVGQLKSDVTDLKHTGDRFGGAITAALFLREFTGGVPWMHCDIPGPVYRDRPSGMHPKGATGHAVLTFAKLIEMHGKSPLAAKPAEKPAQKSVKKPATRRATAKKSANSTKSRR
jgi:leucyl aminopeptidase